MPAVTNSSAATLNLDFILLALDCSVALRMSIPSALSGLFLQKGEGIGIVNRFCNEQLRRRE